MMFTAKPLAFPTAVKQKWRKCKSKLKFIPFLNPGTFV